MQEKDDDVFLEALEMCKRNIPKIIEDIEKLKVNTNDPYIIRILNLYNPFPNVELADKRVHRFNNHINTIAKEEHVKVADIYNIFKGKEKELLSFDQIHPNDNGYKKIAESLHYLGMAH